MTWEEKHCHHVICVNDFFVGLPAIGITHLSIAVADNHAHLYESSFLFSVHLVQCLGWAGASDGVPLGVTMMMSLRVQSVCAATLKCDSLVDRAC